MHQAHTYISKNAPDFGGDVHHPCGAALAGDKYTVTCSGIINATTGGDGSVKESFSCVGIFVQGEDGLFFQTGPVHCK
jgi:hypothetical protein